MRRTVLLWAALLCATGARALVIDGGNGTQNFTAPSGTGTHSDPGFANVGNMGGGTGVYLGDYNGNYWVLTAGHVGIGNITLGGTTYGAVGGSDIRVQNPGAGDTDLTLFRLATNPGLPTLTINPGSTPANGSLVRYMGAGLRESAAAQWSVTRVSSPATDTWNLVSSGGEYSGYTTTGSGGVRWGDGVVAGTETYNIGYGVTTTFATQFSDNVGLAQAQIGDSGGATFLYNASSQTWSLAGIIDAIGIYDDKALGADGQPTNIAVYNNYTFAVDLSVYRSFIAAAIAVPEPGVFAAGAGGIVLLTALLRRRRK